jgi:hypothetical protein
VQEQNLRAAMLLEQSAICYLRAVPPLWRKFGFHMVLAGHRYNQGLQVRPVSIGSPSPGEIMEKIIMMKRVI